MFVEVSTSKFPASAVCDVYINTLGSASNISITGLPSGVSGELVVNESDVILHPLNLRLAIDNGNSSVDTLAGINDDEVLVLVAAS